MILSILALLVAGVSAEQCQRACPFTYFPVCGSDGVTYSNDCQLTSFNCLRQTSVAIAHYGACVSTKVDSCIVPCTRQWSPVCGTDAVTYGNRCAMEAAACKTKSDISVLYAGECAVATLASSCNIACTREYIPVCGTNGRTYGNRCALESDSCLQKSGVTVAHAGTC